jgi:hypothetical protein
LPIPICRKRIAGLNYYGFPERKCQFEEICPDAIFFRP